MKAWRGLQSKAFCNILDLVEDFVATRGEDSFEDPCDGDQVLIDLIDLRAYLGGYPLLDVRLLMQDQIGGSVCVGNIGAGAFFLGGV